MYDFSDFEKMHNRVMNGMAVYAVLIGLASIGGLVFVGYVILRVLAHFGM